MNAVVEKIIPLERTCFKCNALKPIAEFYKASSEKTGHNFMCKSCHTGWHRDRLRNDPEWREQRYKERNESYKNNPLQKERAYSRSLKKNYGITLEEAKSILSSQHGLCANRGCGEKVEFFAGKKSDNQAVIDHCNTTKKIRGVLCSKCNFALGHLKDSVNRALGLVEYLNKSNT